MKDHLPTNAVFVEDRPSELIKSHAFSGEALVIFELEVQKDIYMGPNVNPIDDYISKSSFPDLLQKIINTDGVELEGAALQLKSEMSKWGVLHDLRNNLLDNDYSDIIKFNAYEAVTGIYSVTACVEGQSKIESMRKIDADVLDALGIEVVTDFLIVQAAPKGKE